MEGREGSGFGKRGEMKEGWKGVTGRGQEDTETERGSERERECEGKRG